MGSYLDRWIAHRADDVRHRPPPQYDKHADCVLSRPVLGCRNRFPFWLLGSPTAGQPVCVTRRLGCCCRIPDLRRTERGDGHNRFCAVVVSPVPWATSSWRRGWWSIRGQPSDDRPSDGAYRQVADAPTSEALPARFVLLRAA